MKRVAIALFAAGVMASSLVIRAHPATASATATAGLSVKVTLKDYQVVVRQRRLPAGKPITFVVTNRGHHVHELVLEKAGMHDMAIRFRGRTYEADDIKPGATHTVTWIIPAPGMYQFACHRGNHFQMGMKTLIRAVSK